MSYHHHRPPQWGRNPKLERAITVIVLGVVVLALVVFLFIYHDVPLRVP